ncbi:MAG: thiamine diphosphokinase [Alphaproteobacteria bacterium]
MIDINNLLENIKSVLCLNGVIPNKEFFDTYKHLPFFATDGAFNSLKKIGISANTIIGDFDSVCSDQLSKSTEQLFIEDQNYTDFEKSIGILKERSLFPCLICGVSGKELDHTIYNIYVIKRIAKNLPVIFYDSGYEFCHKFGIISAKDIRGKLPLNSLISLLPFPKTTISTKGLKWNLNNFSMDQESMASVRNRVDKAPFVVNVHSGDLLLLFQF